MDFLTYYVYLYSDMEPVGLAVDWVYGHLYWTDTVYRSVMMSNLDGTGRIIVVTKNLIIPRGIAVDPKRRSVCSPGYEE